MNSDFSNVTFLRQKDNYPCKVQEILFPQGSKSGSCRILAVFMHNFISWAVEESKYISVWLLVPLPVARSFVIECFLPPHSTQEDLAFCNFASFRKLSHCLIQRVVSYCAVYSLCDSAGVAINSTLTKLSSTCYAPDRDLWLVGKQHCAKVYSLT